MPSNSHDVKTQRPNIDIRRCAAWCPCNTRTAVEVNEHGANGRRKTVSDMLRSLQKSSRPLFKLQIETLLASSVISAVTFFCAQTEQKTFKLFGVIKRKRNMEKKIVKSSLKIRTSLSHATFLFTNADFNIAVFLLRVMYTLRYQNFFSTWA
jgi:hypothetical protein